MNYSESELRETFGSVGANVAVHKSCVLFGGPNIHIGSNVRIDCFSMISAGAQGVFIGDHVHIAAGAYLFGSNGKIVLESFSSLSARVTLFTGSDDFILGHMTNPTVPAKYRFVTSGDIVLKKHAIVGCGSVIMPATLGVGAAVGALSFVSKDVGDFEIVRGSPAVPVGFRRDDMLEFEQSFLAETVGGQS
ncbi:MAG: acyltransferase [Acidobacteriaceae bacterium]|nr:acyltransferase [Acidobacteriaceae bacterium]